MYLITYFKYLYFYYITTLQTNTQNNLGFLMGGAENASTGKRKYGKCKYNANLHSDKKRFGTSQVLVWVHFKWGGQVDYRLFFSEIA